MEFLFALTRFIVTCLFGIWLLRQMKRSKSCISDGDESRFAHLQRLKSISLTPPLTEKARPSKLEDVIGQEEGIRALRAALFGKYPQHVILYGPPGVGKTCAARLIFEEARKSKNTPFRADAPFIEMDASILRYDERGIADPLLGSVHDPIYQGAGEKGEKGVPQPKEGAVTRAHGGVLFLDEIGEMHPGHMNRLLKVMEDRRVRLESAYFDPMNPACSDFVRSVFTSGLPADFRLIAATTKRPEELPGALRSRCVEVFFQPLTSQSLFVIAKGAARRAGFQAKIPLLRQIGDASENGRDCIRLLLLASGAAASSGREVFTGKDVAWAIEVSGRKKGFEKTDPLINRHHTG